jgi:hypothetical protein
MTWIGLLLLGALAGRCANHTDFANSPGRRIDHG